MIAPGIRVVRGPDWIWQNQGEHLNSDKNFSIIAFKSDHRKKNMNEHYFENERKNHFRFKIFTIIA